MVCLKCGSGNITINDANVASRGLEAVKGIVNAGYWGLEIVSGLAKNVYLPGPLGVVTKLDGMGSHLVLGLLKQKLMTFLKV